MIQEISGVCKHCSTEYVVMFHLGGMIGSCVECGKEPVFVKQFDGLVYVVSNPNMNGVKIGMTRKSVEERVKQLSRATGVPGSFEVLAIFPSRRAKKDEQMVHRKLNSYRIEKEHFQLSPLDGVLKTYRALNKKIEPIFYQNSLRRQFFLQLEADRNLMERRLAGMSDRVDKA